MTNALCICWSASIPCSHAVFGALGPVWGHRAQSPSRREAKA